MTSYSLSQIHNFRSCNAGVPTSLEHEAIWETITDGWSFDEIQATAREGIADVDAEAIEALIAEEGFSVDVGDAIDTFVAACRDRVAFVTERREREGD